MINKNETPTDLFSKNLKFLMEYKDISINELEKRSEVGRSTIFYARKNDKKHSLTLSTCANLANALGVDLGAMLSYSIKDYYQKKG